jgi:predicted TIM-barrel fold metal-dependent hydrolase
MIATGTTRAMQIRAGLGHPVIDADGHTIEVTPVLHDYIKDVGGPDALARFSTYNRQFKDTRTSLDARSDYWNADSTPLRWVFPGRTLDRATAALPRLYYERMEELGLDFSLVYPTFGLRIQIMRDDALRPLACRALNTYMAEMHDGLSDRILPVAAIPMHTPAEAIEEMEYAVQVLGMRAILIPNFVPRPIPRVHRDHPEYDDVALRFDTYGVDGEHDYDPVWAKCVELGVVPSVHTPATGFGFHKSISSYVHNHIGTFASSCAALCKSLLLGGVFHRFPTLKVAALEGGAGWATSLYADFISHWEKRNGDVIQSLNPERMDRELLTSLLSTYGSDRVQARLEEIREDMVYSRQPPDGLDEFRACPFKSSEEIRDFFTSRIYIGCEADDPINALAFNSRVNPFGARFRIIFGSDISHWDVPDVGKVLEEAYELVEHGLITEADFYEFTFSNAARLYAETNPGFFRGTGVESAVSELLGPADASEV